MTIYSLTTRDEILKHIAEYLRDCLEVELPTKLWIPVWKNIDSSMPLSRLKNYSHASDKSLYGMVIFRISDSKVNQKIRPYSPFSNVTSIFAVMYPFHVLWKEGYTIGIASSESNNEAMKYSNRKFIVNIKNVDPSLFNSYIGHLSLAHDVGIWPSLVRVEKVSILSQSLWEYITKWKIEYDLEIVACSHVPNFSDFDLGKYIRHLFGAIIAEVEFLEKFGRNIASSSNTPPKWRINTSDRSYFFSDSETLKKIFDKFKPSNEDIIIDNLTKNEKSVTKFEGVRITFASEICMPTGTKAFSTIYRIMSVILTMKDSSNFRRFLVRVSDTDIVTVKWILWLPFSQGFGQSGSFYEYLFPKTLYQSIEWSLLNEKRFAIYLVNLQSFGLIDEPSLETITAGKSYFTDESEKNKSVTDSYQKYGLHEWKRMKAAFDAKVFSPNLLDISSIKNSHKENTKYMVALETNKVIGYIKVLLPLFKEDGSFASTLFMKNQKLIMFKQDLIEGTTSLFFGFNLNDIKDSFLLALAEIPLVQSLYMLPGDNSRYKVLVHAIVSDQKVVMSQLGFLFYVSNTAVKNFFDVTEDSCCVPTINDGIWNFSLNTEDVLKNVALDHIIHSLTIVYSLFGEFYASCSIWRSNPTITLTFSFEQGHFDVLDDLLNNSNFVEAICSFKAIIQPEGSFDLYVGFENEQDIIQMRKFLQNYRILRYFFTKYSKSSKIYVKDILADKTTSFENIIDNSHEDYSISTWNQ